MGVILLSFLPSCGSSVPPAWDKAKFLPKAMGLIVAEGDSESATGVVEAIEPLTHTLIQRYGTSFDRDQRLRALWDNAILQKRYFLLAATLGTVSEITQRGAIVHTFPVYDEGAQPSSADPLDLALASDGSLWITRYLQNTLLVLNKDGTRRRTVDLSAFADADGRVEMSAITMVKRSTVFGGREQALVALRRLGPPTDSSLIPSASNDSYLVMIDTESYEVRRWAVLAARNPWEQFRKSADASISPAELYVSCIGGPLTKPIVEGALVKIHLDESAEEKRTSVALSSKAAGGFVTGFAIANATTGFAIVAGTDSADNPTSVVRFDVERGEVTTVYRKTPKYSYFDLQLSTSHRMIFITDRTKENPSVLVLSTDDGAALGRIPTRNGPLELQVTESL